MADLAQGDPVPPDRLNAIERQYLKEEPLAEFIVPLSSARYTDGDPINATGAAGDPKIVSGGYGSGTLSIEGADAVGNTKTDTFFVEFPLPPGYVAGGDLNFSAFAYCDNSSGPTITVKTLDAQVYSDDGVNVSADICATTIKTLGTSPSTDNEHEFTITATGLTTGTLLRIYVQTVITETAGGGVHANSVIQGLKVKADIKG